MREPSTFTDRACVAIVALLVLALVVGFSILEAPSSAGGSVLR